MADRRGGFRLRPRLSPLLALEHPLMQYRAGRLPNRRKPSFLRQGPWVYNPCNSTIRKPAGLRECIIYVNPKRTLLRKDCGVLLQKERACVLQLTAEKSGFPSAGDKLAKYLGWFRTPHFTRQLFS